MGFLNYLWLTLIIIIIIIIIIITLFKEGITHNSNSTDELMVLDLKSTVVRIKMYSRIIKLVN